MFLISELEGIWRISFLSAIVGHEYAGENLWMCYLFLEIAGRKSKREDDAFSWVGWALGKMVLLKYSRRVR